MLRAPIVPCLLVALLPVAVEISALVTTVIVAVLLAAVIVFETSRQAELRDRLRHQHH